MVLQGRRAPPDTISKSISAYDMAVSDAIYGRCKRYVSRERCRACSTMSTNSISSGCEHRAATAPPFSPSPIPSRPATSRHQRMPRMDGSEVPGPPAR